jgi:endonuclease/exonuclease/phosphatase family metal-dependent hydrolase
MRSLALLLLVPACGGTSSTVTPASTPTTVTVVTYNLYLGADLTPLTSAMGGDRAAAVTQIFDAVKATDPDARMDLVADQIASAAPDLVALQEVAEWRTQTPADGTATPANDVAFDFLTSIVDGLARRGLTYQVAVVGTNSDVEATATGNMDVRFTDRDVILARQGFATGNVTMNKFETELMVSGITVTRGWIAVEPAGFRFMNTHLESASDAIRDAQAAQVLVDSANATPLVLAGDFNFDPSSLPYSTFKTAELNDSADAGPTCCQDPDLRNAGSKLDTRIDLVWTRGGFTASGAALIGLTKTASGVWPSDHAGVRVTLSR